MLKQQNNIDIEKIKIEDDEEVDDDEYIMNLKKNFNIMDNISNYSDDNLSDNDLNNYKLNNEIVALANEVSKTLVNDKKDNLNNSKIINDVSSATFNYYSFNNVEKDDDDSKGNKNYFDIDDECLLPEFDWANLEAKLKEESLQRELIQQQVS